MASHALRKLFGVGHRRSGDAHADADRILERPAACSPPPRDRGAPSLPAPPTRWRSAGHRAGSRRRPASRCPPLPSWRYGSPFDAPHFHGCALLRIFRFVGPPCKARSGPPDRDCARWAAAMSCSAERPSSTEDIASQVICVAATGIARLFARPPTREVSAAPDRRAARRHDVARRPSARGSSAPRGSSPARAPVRHRRLPPPPAATTRRREDRTRPPGRARP